MSSVIDSVIALENAKRNCDPKVIQKRAEEKTAELFPPSYVAKVTEDVMAVVDAELSALRKEIFSV